MSEMLPMILAVGITVVAVIGLIMLTGKSKLRKEVIFLRPRDKRGEKLDITRETDRSILCEKSDPVHRFIKIGPSFIFKDGGKTSIRFFGVEGSAYTSQFKEEKELKMPISDYLKTIWGDKLYEALPVKLKQTLSEDKVGVTIEPVKINPEDYGLKHISSDDVNDEGDAIVLTRLAKYGQTESMKQKLLGNLVWLGLGVGLAAILSNAGWF